MIERDKIGFQQFPAPRKTRFHRSDFAFQLLRYFFIRHIVHMPQDHRFPERFRQSLQSAEHILLQLLVLKPRIRSLPLIGQRNDPLFSGLIDRFRNTCHQPFAAAAVPMELVAGKVDHNPLHPGFKTGISAKTVQRTERPDKRVLDNFLRILLRIQKPVCRPVKFRRIQGNQTVKRRLVTRLEALNQLRGLAYYFNFFI